MTAQANVTELLTRLNAVLGVPAYDVGMVPTKRPPEFVELTLTRRYGGVPTLCGTKTTTGYRFTVAAVSQFLVENVRGSLERCRAEFENELLIVAGSESTPIEFETEDEADYGSGWFSAYQSYTYVI